MGHPEPVLERERLVGALTAMLRLSMPACAAVEYRLVGTAAALLHGVDLPTADVDILVRERAGVDAFAAALSACQCLAPPAWLSEGRQYYARYLVEGVEVEFSTVEVASEADYVETCGRGPWEHHAEIPCGPYLVPTVALELRLITELRRGRADRYAPIIGYLRQRGCDATLLRRGLAGIGLSTDRQAEVLAQLGLA